MKHITPPKPDAPTEGTIVRVISLPIRNYKVINMNRHVFTCFVIVVLLNTFFLGWSLPTWFGIPCAFLNGWMVGKGLILYYRDLK